MCIFSPVCLSVDELMGVPLLPLWGYYSQCCSEFLHESFCVDILFLLGLCVGAESLGRMVTLCSITGGTARLSWQLNHFMRPAGVYRASISPHPY